MLSIVDKRMAGLVLSALLGAAAPHACAAPTSAEAVLVAHLYKDFGWQAFAYQKDLFGDVLAHQPKAVLGRYFSPQLAGLLVKDLACQVRERGICKLDFDLLFDSQDPAVTDLEVQSLAPGKVRVRFKNPMNGEITAIEFVVDRIGGRWKIADVLYEPKAERSLKKILQGH